MWSEDIFSFAVNVWPGARQSICKALNLELVHNCTVLRYSQWLFLEAWKRWVKECGRRGKREWKVGENTKMLKKRKTANWWKYRTDRLQPAFPPQQNDQKGKQFGNSNKLQTDTRTFFIWWASESAKLEANPFVCDCFWKIAARPCLVKLSSYFVWEKSRCNNSDRCKAASITIVSAIYHLRDCNPIMILSTNACNKCLYLENEKC